MTMNINVAITEKAPLLEILMKIVKSLYKFTFKVIRNTNTATHDWENFEKHRMSVTGYNLVLKIEFIKNRMIL